MLVVLFIFFQIYTAMAAGKTETQVYNILLSKNDFEIRFYPAATFATIKSSAKSYKELGSAGFRKLAGYIFGGNESAMKISMTTPVRMDINDSESTMSFVMPSAYSLANLPKPTDKQVIVSAVADEFVAAIKFGGYASENDVKNYAQKLTKALQENNIRFYGNFQLLVYNAPFQFINRRNEIIVNVHWPSGN